MSCYNYSVCAKVTPVMLRGPKSYIATWECPVCETPQSREFNLKEGGMTQSTKVSDARCALCKVPKPASTAGFFRTIKAFIGG